jgi:hypothetical protein
MLYVPRVGRAALRYQEEPTELRAVLWDQGYISAWQLLRIAVWKSSTGYLGHLATNSEKDIKDRTREAMSCALPYKDASEPPLGSPFFAALSASVGALRQIHGVGLPVASAVLCILNPGVWPVIDRWATRRLFGCNVLGSTEFYQAYLVRLAQLVELHQELETVHAADQAVSNGRIMVNAVPWKSLSLSVPRGERLRGVDA